MKIIALIIALFVSPVQAKMYKCEANGRTSYQQSPCKGGKEIKAHKEPTEADRIAAIRRNSQYLQQKAEKELIYKQNLERNERLQIERSKAYVNEQNAIANIQQVEQNKQILKELKNPPSVYVFD